MLDELKSCSTRHFDLRQGDCMELMKDIPDGSVDMILCDLPYGTSACKWDSVIPFEPLWEQYKRIIKDNGAIVLFGSEPFATELRHSNLKMFRYDWIWNKVNSPSGLSAKTRPLKQHEVISVFSKNTPCYFPIMTKGKMRNKKSYGSKAGSVYGEIEKSKDEINDLYYPKTILTFSNASQRGKVHPTQKPVALLEYLVKTYTNPGEVVLDNCMGSGSTGVACVNTGRKFIGMELDQGYFKIADKRISDACNSCVGEEKKDGQEEQL